MAGVGSGSVGVRWGGLHLPVAIPGRVGRRVPDRLLDRLIGGRAWIVVIAFALIGIVAMQLWVVKLGVGIGRALEHTQLLQQENSTLASEDSALSSAERIERLALAKGMVPASPAVLHFDTLRGPLDARLAAAALAKPIQAPTTSSTPVGGAATSTESSTGAASEEASAGPASSEPSSTSGTSGAGVSPDSTSSAGGAATGTEAASVAQAPATPETTAAAQTPAPTGTQAAPSATGGSPEAMGESGAGVGGAPAAPGG
jgi:cell division protein FtsL